MKKFNSLFRENFRFYSTSLVFSQTYRFLKLNDVIGPDVYEDSNKLEFSPSMLTVLCDEYKNRGFDAKLDIWFDVFIHSNVGNHVIKEKNTFCKVKFL